MQKSFIFSVLFITLLFLGYNQSFAESYKSAEDFIANLSHRTLQIIQSKDSENKKSVQLEKIFNDAVDVKWMAKFAIAKFWKSMSEKQKENYLKAYQYYLIKTYVPRFKEYNNQEIKIVGTKDIGNEQYIVSTQIVSMKGSEKNIINVGYRCKSSNGIYNIRDITGEDFSLLSTQRSEFSSIIAKNGIDKLIQILSEK